MWRFTYDGSELSLAHTAFTLGKIELLIPLVEKVNVYLNVEGGLHFNT